MADISIPLGPPNPSVQREGKGPIGETALSRDKPVGQAFLWETQPHLYPSPPHQGPWASARPDCHQPPSFARGRNSTGATGVGQGRYLVLKALLNLPTTPPIISHTTLFLESERCWQEPLSGADARNLRNTKKLPSSLNLYKPPNCPHVCIC